MVNSTTTLGECPKGKGAISQNCYFLKEGILIVRTSSPILYISVGILWIIVVQATFDGGTSENLVTLLQVSGITILSLVVWTWVKLKRRALERSDLVQYVRNHEDELVQWRDISQFNLDGDKMTFEAGGEGYELRLTGSDIDRIRELISSNSVRPN